MATTTFNLESSVADRFKFDEMVLRDAEGMLETLPFSTSQEDDAWLVDPDQYAEIAFDNFQIVAVSKDDYEEGYGYSIIVDDMAAAKAHYMDVFPQAVRDWQKEEMIGYLEEEMDTEEKGYVDAIEVVPGGQKDGLDYGPVVIDIVTLETDGALIAYRQSDDGQDGDWTIGGIEDAVNEALGVREQLVGLAEELEEMAAQAEVLAAL